MSASINELVLGIHVARAEAETLGTYVALCPASSTLQCRTDRQWADGWIVFVNSDRDDPPRRDDGEPILLRGSGWHGGDIQANRAGFVLRPFGIRSTNGTLTFCDGRGNSRAVILSYTGRPRTSDTAPNGDALSC